MYIIAKGSCKLIYLSKAVRTLNSEVDISVKKPLKNFKFSTTKNIDSKKLKKSRNKSSRSNSSSSRSQFGYLNPNLENSKDIDLEDLKVEGFHNNFMITKDKKSWKEVTRNQQETREFE